MERLTDISMNDEEAKSVKKIKSNFKKGYSLLGLNFSNLFRKKENLDLLIIISRFLGVR